MRSDSETDRETEILEIETKSNEDIADDEVQPGNSLEDKCNSKNDKLDDDEAQKSDRGQCEDIDKSDATDPDDDTFDEEEANDQLLRKKRQKMDHKCPYDGCNKVFQKPSRLTWHIRTHTGERPFKCTHENCIRTYATSSHLKRHLTTHKPIQIHLIYVCQICKLKLKTKQNLLKHQRRVHENKDRLSCSECGCVFRKKYILEQHMLLHKGTKLSCDICDKKFNSLIKFRRHKSHHEKTKYYCKEPECQAWFATLETYQEHCRTHEVTDPKKMREKKLKSRLASHKKDHGELLTCPHDNCHRVYLYQSNLNYHIRTKHEGIKKFECDICKMRFAVKRRLIYHFKKFHNNSDSNNVEVIESEKNIQNNGKDAASKRTNNKEMPKKPRRKRFDAGMPKWSMTTRLSGLKLPVQMEKTLLNRETKIKFSNETFSNVETNVKN